MTSKYGETCFVEHITSKNDVNITSKYGETCFVEHITSKNGRLTEDWTDDISMNGG